MLPMIGSQASAADGSKLVFAWQAATVYQEVSAPNNWASSSTLTATVSAAEVQDWKVSSDQLTLAINLYGSGGGGICSHSTALTELTDGGVFNDYTLTVSSSGACSAAFSAAVASIRLSIIGKDGEFWAGNYGTQVESASLKLDGVELLSNTEFNSVTSNAATGWTSSLGWQACSGGAGALPCVGLSAVQINSGVTTTTTPPTTLPPTTTTPPTTTIPPVAFDGSACATSTTYSNFAYGGSGTLASSSPDTFRLTQATGNQFGAIWNKARFDISDDFCVKAEVYLGDNDGGADGLALVMQPNSVAAGSTGGGLGYAGITPSFALEFDTWQNSDPASDHVGLMYNGNTSHYAGSQWPSGADGSQSGVYTPVEVPNIEDGNWRYFKLFWQASTEKMSVLFDRNADGDLSDAGELLYDEVSIDLGSIFTSGNAYWGFTAATGGANNLQQVRNITYEALSRTNSAPTMPTAPVSTTIQSTLTGTIPFVLADESTTSGQWSFSFSSSDTTVLPTNAISAAMSSATEGNISITPPYGNGGSSTVTMNVTDADGSTISASFLVTVTAAPVALTVSSLADTGASGTLRWAITQANATSGGMYDAIVFATNGTITLTSSLPQITQSVTITGNGKTNTIIDGNYLHRPFNVASGRTLTVSNMTLKQGPSANGGLIYNGAGTVNATNLRFTAMNGGSAVWNNNGTSVATYTDCTWDALSTGIGGDYGSTPSLTVGYTSWDAVNPTNGTLIAPDTVFSNRTYVIRGTFTGNTYGINQQRFTKVQDSTFTNNTYAASINGLNRSQILDSTFTGSTTAIYHSSWIPVGWNMGTNNRLIDGNTFTNNTIAIDLSDGYNNGQRYQGWATVSDNSWDDNGTWVRYSVWNSTSNTNTTGTLTPGQETTLFAQSGNSVPTTTTTTTVPPTTTVAPPQTTTSPATTTSEPSTTQAPETTESPQTTIPEETDSTTSTVLDPEEEDAETTSTVPDVTGPELPEEESTEPEEETTSTSTPPQEEEQPESTDTTEEDQQENPQENNTDTETVFDDPEAVAQLIEETPEDEVAAVVVELISEVAEEEVASAIAEVADDLSGEQLSEVLEAVFEDVSEEAIVEIVATVLDEIAPNDGEQLTEEDKEKIVAVVEAVISSGLNESVAETLASNAAVLESVSESQAEQVFETIEASNLTEEVAEAIVDAVQDAPEAIREVFEDAVSLFEGAFDNYVMTGQTINVGQRRTVVAVNLITTSVTAAIAAGGAIPGPSGGGSPSGSSPSGSANDAARKEEEEESEMNGELAGDELDWVKKISIYKTVNGVRKMDWKAFFKKFGFGMMNMGWTLSGAVVVYLTLSGSIQKIAGALSVLAFGAAMYLHMKDPEE